MLQLAQILATKEKRSQFRNNIFVAQLVDLIRRQYHHSKAWLILNTCDFWGHFYEWNTPISPYPLLMLPSNTRSSKKGNCVS